MDDGIEKLNGHIQALMKSKLFMTYRKLFFRQGEVNCKNFGGKIFSRGLNLEHFCVSGKSITANAKLDRSPQYHFFRMPY